MHQVDRQTIARQKKQLELERKEFELNNGNLRNKYNELLRKLDEQDKTIENLLKQNSELRRAKNAEEILIEDTNLRSSQQLFTNKSGDRSTLRPRSQIMKKGEFRIVEKALSEKKFELTNQNEMKRKVTNLRNINKKKDYLIEKDDLMLTRLSIQVDQKTKELARLKDNMETTNNELVRLKKVLKEKQKKEMKSIVTSEKNPNIQSHYNLKMKKMRQQNSNLKERLRTYTIQEKRILIKERAFELERADTANKLINLKNDMAKLRVENYHLKNKKNEF